MIVNNAGTAEESGLSKGKCLRSWKEIAAYLRCSVITVQRWEKREGLPVHRHLHNKLGSAYAFTAEIDRWLRERSQTAPENAIHATPARRQPPMLAVLPFENLTGDAEQEYFSDGITEEVTTEIGCMYAGQIGVIARTSVVQYKSLCKTTRRIARELGADYVLEGSVRRSDGRFRIAVRLIKASDQAHCWAHAYERAVGDILDVQADIARAVAEKVGAELSAPCTQRRRSPNPEAFELCLQGRFHWYKLGAEHFHTALSYFQLAVERDPDYALAYVGIAEVWGIRADNGLIPPSEAYPKMQKALTRALELDDALAEARVAAGNVRFCHEWSWSAAEAEFVRALQLNPNSAYAHFCYSDFLISMRRFEDAASELASALRLDPVNFFFRCFRGWHLLYMGRPADAVVELRKTVRMQPDLAAAHLALWGAFYRLGKLADALREARIFYSGLGDNEISEALDGVSGSRLNYRAAMRRAAETLAARSNRTYVPAIRIARLYGHAGRKDEALDWLGKAHENHEPPLVHLNVGWDWHELREHPRFQKLLREMHFPKGE